MKASGLLSYKMIFVYREIAIKFKKQESIFMCDVKYLGNFRLFGLRILERNVQH